jgi:hypothetical protein
MHYLLLVEDAMNKLLEFMEISLSKLVSSTISKISWSVGTSSIDGSSHIS